MIQDRLHYAGPLGDLALDLPGVPVQPAASAHPRRDTSRSSTLVGGEMRVWFYGVLITVLAVAGCGSTIRSFSLPDFSSRVRAERVIVRLITGAGAISTVTQSASAIRSAQVSSGEGQAIIAAQTLAFELLNLGFRTTDLIEEADIYVDFSIGTVRLDPLAGWIADQAILTFREPDTGTVLASYQATSRSITATVNNLVSNLVERLAADLRP